MYLNFQARRINFEKVGGGGGLIQKFLQGNKKKFSITSTFNFLIFTSIFFYTSPQKRKANNIPLIICNFSKEKCLLHPPPDACINTSA